MSNEPRTDDSNLLPPSLTNVQIEVITSHINKVVLDAYRKGYADGYREGVEDGIETGKTLAKDTGGRYSVD